MVPPVLLFLGALWGAVAIAQQHTELLTCRKEPPAASVSGP